MSCDTTTNKAVFNSGDVIFPIMISLAFINNEWNAMKSVCKKFRPLLMMFENDVLVWRGEEFASLLLKPPNCHQNATKYNQNTTKYNQNCTKYNQNLTKYIQNWFPHKDLSSITPGIHIFNSGDTNSIFSNTQQTTFTSSYDWKGWKMRIIYEIWSSIRSVLWLFSINLWW